MLVSIYCRNGDTLGPIVRMEQGNQGDRREQDDQGEVSIIIFGMSKSSGFQKYNHLAAPTPQEMIYYQMKKIEFFVKSMEMIFLM